MLIREVLEDKNKLFLITLPRRWGKSVQLRMIRNFFEIEVDHHGDGIHWEATWAYKTFITGEFRNFIGQRWFIEPLLLIGEEEAFIDEHMSQWPVIYLKFNVGLRENVHNMLSGIMFQVRSEYGAHTYVTERFHKIIEDKTTDKETRSMMRKRLNRFKDIRYSKIKLEEEEVRDSLRFLSEVLHDHFGQKVVIMIDDYDSLWDSLFLRDDFEEEERKKFVQFYLSFLERTFINNPDMELGFVVGLYRPPKEYFEKVFDRFAECNLVTGKFLEYFGFNQYEVPPLFEHFMVNPYRQRNLTDLYNGYKVKNGSLTVYNAGSLVNFFAAFTSFDHIKMIPYLQHPWSIKKLIFGQLELDSFNARFFNLINNQSIVVRGDRYNYTWHELELLYGRPWPEDEEIDAEWYADTALMQMYMLGYLADAEGEVTEPYKLLKIPNSETMQEMRKFMEKYYGDKLGMNLKWIDFCRNFIKKEVRYFIEDNTTNCTFVREGYEFYLREPYSVYSRLSENSSETDSLLHDVLSYSLKDFFCVRRESYPPSINPKSPNILLILNDRAISFKIKFKESCVEQVLQETIDQTDLNEIHEPVQTIQYVALNVIDNDGIPDVEMCSEFQHIPSD